MKCSEDFTALIDAVSQRTELRSHSGKVQPGDAFVALPGTRVDGASYIEDALDRGAAWVAGTEEALRKFQDAGDSRARFVVCDDPRQALGDLAAARYGTDALPFALIGVTGTNGKTTVAFLIEHLFAANKRRAGLLGTVAHRWPGFSLTANMTTPDCLELHQFMANMAQARVQACVMEVSSHALQQNRTAGLVFDLAVFTNLTQDHLDYHKDMADYFAAKSKLFRDQPAHDKAGVLNWDDPYGRVLLEQHRPALGYGLNPAPDWLGVTVPGLRGEILESSVQGLHLRMDFEGWRWELRSPLVGRYNASNLLAAQAAGLAMGLEPHAMQALATFTGVPGRLERVAGRNIFVDYAHTPDALENVLRALKELKLGRLITVFGCGGDRDRAKRPLMGKAACEHSDVVVLTSDNPRHENPEAIIQEVLPGMQGRPNVQSTPDRKQAIATALAAMKEGDVLLVAGKGHEDYQQIGDEKKPFSDQAVIREILGCS